MASYSVAQCVAPDGALLHWVPAVRPQHGCHHAIVGRGCPPGGRTGWGHSRVVAQATQSTYADAASNDQARRGAPPLLERTGELAALLQQLGTAAIASGPTGAYRCNVTWCWWRMCCCWVWLLTQVTTVATIALWCTAEHGRLRKLWLQWLQTMWLTCNAASCNHPRGSCAACSSASAAPTSSWGR